MVAILEIARDGVLRSQFLPLYHSTDLLTARGVAQLVVHGTTGSTSYETIPPFVRLESSGGVLSTVDMVVQRRDGPRRLREHDDDDDDDFLPRLYTVYAHSFPFQSLSLVPFPRDSHWVIPVLKHAQ